MMKPEVFYCEVCQAEKKDVNHWFVIVPTAIEIRQAAILSSGNFGQKTMGRLETELRLLPWSVEAAKTPGALHYCGAAHAMQKINEFFGAQS